MLAWSAALVSVLALTANIAMPAGAAGEAVTDKHRDICREVSVPVAIAGGQGKMRGTLCVPPGAETIQVLVHGHTYNRLFWDSPYKPGTYSYVRSMNEAGYATLAIDRLGAGSSYRPLSAVVTYESSVKAAHAFVTAARDGRFGREFDSVVLVGHSMGSGIVYGMAGKYRDVDAVVIVGGGHQVGVDYVARNYTSQVRLAALDPKFADLILDPGYITTADHNIFINKANAEPRILQLNQTVMKDVDSAVALGGYLMTVGTNRTSLRLSKNINIPTLTINGQSDGFFCRAGSILPPLVGDVLPTQAPDCSSAKALARFERPYFGPGATVDADVVVGSGHGVTVEKTAPIFYRKIKAWLADQF